MWIFHNNLFFKKKTNKFHIISQPVYAWLSDCPAATKSLEITSSPRSPLRMTRRLSWSGLSLLEGCPSACHQMASLHRWKSHTAFLRVHAKKEEKKDKRERDTLWLVEFNVHTKRGIKHPRRGKQLKRAQTFWSVPVNFKQFSRSPGATPLSNEMQERPGRTRPFEYVWSHPGTWVFVDGQRAREPDPPGWNKVRRWNEALRFIFLFFYFSFNMSPPCVNRITRTPNDPAPKRFIDATNPFKGTYAAEYNHCSQLLIRRDGRAGRKGWWILGGDNLLRSPCYPSPY